MKNSRSGNVGLKAGIRSFGRGRSFLIMVCQLWRKIISKQQLTTTKQTPMLKNPLMEQLRQEAKAIDKALIDESFALADRIAFLLKKHNMSQRELADKLGKRESEISKWLSGGHNFTQATLTRISLAIGERIYEIPGAATSDQLASAVESTDSLYIYKAIIKRLMTVHKEVIRTKFENYHELSTLTIGSNGIIQTTSTKIEREEANFVPAKISVRDIKKIEGASLT